MFQLAHKTTFGTPSAITKHLEIGSKPNPTAATTGNNM